ncbi:MAG: hypothetical protein Q7R83_01075 [bacterium]|nr:hypothetical protein [bacterium]
MGRLMWLVTYVKDTRIAEDSPENAGNRKSKKLPSRFSMYWFILTNAEARASLRANRLQFAPYFDGI